MNIRLRWIGAAAALAAAVCVCAGSAGASARASGQVAFHPNNARASTRTGVVHLSTFQSPSHNIVCEIGDEDKAHCETFKPPQGVSLDFRGKVVTCTGRRICGPCPPGATGCSSFARMPVLAYGRRDDYSLYSCVSRTTGVTCTVIRGAAKGKGFRIDLRGVAYVNTAAKVGKSSMLVYGQSRGRLWSLGMVVFTKQIVDQFQFIRLRFEN